MAQTSGSASANQPSEEFIKEFHLQYQQDPNSVPAEWRTYFQQMEQLGLLPQAGAQAAAPSSAAHNEVADEEAPAETLPQEDVTRSDLPPAPPSLVAPPTSAYVNALQSDKVQAMLPTEDIAEKLKGVKAAIVKNMDASLSIPVATSARDIPAKVLIENRLLINQHLARTRGGKVSFTHLIGFALVEALVEMPSMNVRYRIEEGKPVQDHLAHVGFGLAIDLPKEDGTRTLVVPVIQEADRMNFMQFVDAYEELVKKAREGKLTAADYAGGTITLTNPGTIGTKFSVPRLMTGQGCIIGIGATDYPAEWAGASDKQLARAGVGKVMTVTSTYDHRVIQGAGSGSFLKLLGEKLSGKDGFYDRVFSALRVPYEPFTWERNREYDLETEISKPARISELIHAYRSRGHLAADTDPLAYRVRRHPDLRLDAYGLSMWDMDTEFPVGNFAGEKGGRMTLRELLERLRDTYTRTMGIEYMHIQDPVQRKWMQRQIEQPYEKPTKEQREKILYKLNQAEAFETFLQTKYVGQKRFSLEGGESLIPLLDQVIDAAARDGMYEVAIGMAHRGRLNVLANVAGKSNAQIFSEFEGNADPRSVQGSGDVKYHLGTEGVYTSEDGAQTRVYLAANPSHLETVDGVLEGVVRAKLDKIGVEDDWGVLPILIHGDAAFIGQGVVYETFNMSQLKAYKTGGTVHVIVNNQIGFTTGPTSSRSTNYCTDLAKGMQVPIFHVNADDPEMIVHAADLAYRFRQEFHKDVIIDMVCYRRRGHNEGDDPSMTQPVMYALIDAIPSTRSVYVSNLIGRGDLTEEEAHQALLDYHKNLETILEETREHGYQPHAGATATEGATVAGLERPDTQVDDAGQMFGWESAISESVMRRIGDSQVAFPEGFTPHPKVKQLLEKRQKMTREGQIDWGFAELLAFGSLLMERTPIRMSGEDARRATFVQRHAVMHDHTNGQEWTPLNFLTPDQAKLDIYDSSLSEYAPMAFEYGYSVERPEALTLWEAQFGDFAPGGQTVIDEYIVSAEQKWGQQSSLVLLLPHGFEGQGPDHSSARIERYLTLAAQENMYVCQPSTPANYFHLLRAQAYRRPRKPLICFTPKQLLRLRAATSQIADFTSGTFQEVIGDTAGLQVENVDRVLVCSGRIYYDLEAEREKLGDRRTAIIRLEQYYPFHEALLRELDKYPSAEIIWVQDEPVNQGALPFVRLNSEHFFGERKLRWVARPASAAPSVGRASTHKEQNAVLMEQAFAR